MSFRIVKNPKKGICQAHGCLNGSRPGGDRFCAKHRKRYLKNRDPERYTYQALRSNAKRRGKEFLITLKEFREWCKETKYMELKGRSKLKASIDRIDPSRGYEKGNLQILTLQENGRKGFEEKGHGGDPEVPF